MKPSKLVYLDNAATGFPKPPAVIREVERCLKSYCGNAGRSSHTLALRAAEKIYECREMTASLFECDSPENIIFTMNT
ncbi:MAG: aminotransferase class V-fold PLP-dependent enzyme, partial [Clostridia bacterium]|nr:aminotransferase class V-fold PLP-dependent enzyme [Clostridia bacterium]